ncbi:MAG: AsmA-like C-terminal region-containing protein [Rubripirellula sp.]
MHSKLPRPKLLLVLAAFLCLASLGVASAQEAPKPDAKQPAYWTTDWSFRDVDVRKFLSRLKSIGIVIPVEAAGDVSVEVSVSVPLNALSDSKAYRLSGHLSSNRLRLDQLQLQEFDSDIRYINGVLHLDEVSGSWASIQQQDSRGSFAGDARAELVPRGEFQTNLTTKSLPIGPLHDLVRKATQSTAGPLRGELSGNMQLSAPLQKLKSIANWEAKGDLEIKRLQLGDSVAFDVKTGPLELHDSILQLQHASITGSDSPSIHADLIGQLELINQQRFQFRVQGNDLPLSTLSRFLISDEQAVAGKLDIDASGQGELANWVWKIAAQIASPQLKVFQQDLGLLEHTLEFDQQQFSLVPIKSEANHPKMLIQRISAKHNLSPESFKISDLAAELFGGTVEGALLLARKQNGTHRLQLSWDQIEPSFNSALLLPVNTSIAASTSGKMDWSAPADKLEIPAAHQGIAEVILQDLRIAKTPIGQLNVKIRADTGKLDLSGEGKLFGGTVSVQTSTNAGPDERWPQLLQRTPQGSLIAESMRLNQIARTLQPKRTRRWRGELDATLNWGNKTDLPVIQAADSAGASAEITLVARDLAVDGHRLSRNLTMRMRLQGQTVVIDRVSGAYAGGGLTAQGRWSLGRGSRQIQVRVYGVDVSEALFPLSQQTSESVSGKVSGSLTVTGRDRLRIRGSISARDSSLFSVTTGSIHAGVSGALSTNLRQWDLTLHSIRGQLAHGQISGELRLRSSTIRSGAFDMSSHWSARKVNFGQLLASLSGSASFAQGTATGELEVGGRGIRGINDLNGRFSVKLNSAQAASIPGLEQADRYLSLVSLAGVRFQQGYVQGVIGAGNANIDEFWLRSDRIRVWADGTVRLANLRMDLDVVLSTGSVDLGERIVALGSQLAVQSVIPVTTLVEINRLLSDRTLHFNFFGPLTAPQVRIKPLEIIREEAARFLLREILVASSLAVGSH